MTEEHEDTFRQSLFFDNISLFSALEIFLQQRALQIDVLLTYLTTSKSVKYKKQMW